MYGHIPPSRSLMPSTFILCLLLLLLLFWPPFRLYSCEHVRASSLSWKNMESLNLQSCKILHVIMRDDLKHCQEWSSFLDVHNNRLLKLAVHWKMRMMVPTNLHHTSNPTPFPKVNLNITLLTCTHHQSHKKHFTSVSRHQQFVALDNSLYTYTVPHFPLPCLCTLHFLENMLN